MSLHQMLHSYQMSQCWCWTQRWTWFKKNLSTLNDSKHVFNDQILLLKMPIKSGVHFTKELSSQSKYCKNICGCYVKITNSKRATRMPAFWGYPPPPHDYPYYWFILDSKSKQDKVTNLKNLPKIQILEFCKKTFTHNTSSEVAWYV